MHLPKELYSEVFGNYRVSGTSELSQSKPSFLWKVPQSGAADALLFRRARSRAAGRFVRSQFFKSRTA